MKFIKTILHFIYIFCVAIVFAIGGLFVYLAKDLPDITKIQTESRSASVEIQSYDGTVIGSYGDLYESVVLVQSLPSHVIEAFIAIEDKRFFSHFGIDIIGLCRAIYQNYRNKNIVQGGSTITQQLAKNILICEEQIKHNDRSISRKIKELLLALWIEYKFSKNDIIMMYLNRVYFGGGTYGIGAAAKKYFNKSAKDLTIFESAILAGSLKAPGYYNPANITQAKKRAKLVLKKMEQQGYINSANNVISKEGKAAFDHTMQLKMHNNTNYYCDFAYEQAKKILGEINSDIVVITTFNKHHQKVADEAVNYFYNTEHNNYNFSQVSFISLERDGAVTSMIGGMDYNKSQFNRAVNASRLVGSTFKMFIYGAALEYGYQLSDHISDAPISIGNWHPKNYYWHTKGSVSLLTGFTYSVNSVSIRLAQSIGLHRISDFAKKCGITNVSEQDLSVALGTTDITLKDLTAAFTTFMDGYQIFPYCILEIRNKNGDILYSREVTEPVEILDIELLNNCRELLHSVIQNGTGKAAKVNNDIYGKTGTNGDTDAWFIGFYDPEGDDNDNNNGIAVGVWVGNDSISQKMNKKSTGGRIPARIAARFWKNMLINNKKEPEVKLPSSPTNVLDALKEDIQNNYGPSS